MAGNGVREDGYIRIRVCPGGDGDMTATGPAGTTILARPRQQQEVRLERGTRCRVSGWRRIADNASPACAKAAARDVNGRLAGLQARACGHDTALIRPGAGAVVVAPGTCGRIVRDDVLITPPVMSGMPEILARDSIPSRATARGIADGVAERPVNRTGAGATSEARLVGTGMEILPAVGIDRLSIADGTRGSVTKALRHVSLALVHGAQDAPERWISPTTSQLETQE